MAVSLLVYTSLGSAVSYYLTVSELLDLVRIRPPGVRGPGADPKIEYLRRCSRGWSQWNR